MRNQWVLTPFFLDAPQPAVTRLVRPGWRINTPTLPGGVNQLGSMCAVHEPLVADVARIAAAGDRPVSIAGDCCAVIAVLAGLQQAGIEPMVVWLDAHGDFNTHETTLSGFVAGMALAMITGRGDQTLLKADGLTPVPDERVILADARDLDPPERELLQQSRVTHTADVERLPDLVDGRPIHVHLDVDVIDAAEAPATLFPVNGGPSVDTLRRVVGQLRTRAQVISASMTPWAFDRDTDGRTAAACWRVFESLVGA